MRSLTTPMVLMAACASIPAAAESRNHAAAAPAAITSPVPPLEQDDGLPSIPAQFRGVWAIQGSGCAPRAEGRLEITGDELRFPDSLAMPRDLQTDGPNKVRLDLSFEGEGQIWRDLAELELLDGGKRMRRTGADDLSILYHRCGSAK